MQLDLLPDVHLHRGATDVPELRMEDYAVVLVAPALTVRGR